MKHAHSGGHQGRDAPSAFLTVIFFATSSVSAFHGGENKRRSRKLRRFCLSHDRKTRIEGNPDLAHVSTSYVERSNLSVRMHTRRFTRLTNGFSKKVENHAHSVALFAMYYNFVRVHKTLRTSPAMAANVTKRLWEMLDIVDVLEAWEAQQ